MKFITNVFQFIIIEPKVSSHCTPKIKFVFTILKKRNLKLPQSLAFIDKPGDICLIHESLFYFLKSPISHISHMESLATAPLNSNKIIRCTGIYHYHQFFIPNFSHELHSFRIGDPRHGIQGYVNNLHFLILLYFLHRNVFFFILLISVRPINTIISFLLQMWLARPFSITLET